MSAVTVLVEPGSHLDVELAPVLASLPEDFTAVAQALNATGDVPAVRVIDGHQQDWVDHLARALPGAAAVLVHEPVVPIGADGPQQVRDLARAARTHGVPVVIQRRWSTAPGVSAFARAFAGDLTAATAVTVLLVEPHPARAGADALLDALGLARAAGAAASWLKQAHRRPSSWAAWGRTATGALLHLQGVHGAAADGAVLTASSAWMWARMHIPDATSAAPATARYADADGERLLPTEYEAASRATWRRLHTQLQRPRTPTPLAFAGDELEALAEDLTVLAGLAAPADHRAPAPAS